MYLTIVPELVIQSEGQIVRYCNRKAFMLLKYKPLPIHVKDVTFILKDRLIIDHLILLQFKCIKDKLLK